MASENDLGSAKARTKERSLGWREWVVLPELGITRVMAKVDTGARTSALHTVQLQNFVRGCEDWVRFQMPPIPDSNDLVEIERRVKDKRVIRDSGGHEQERPIIETFVRLGDLDDEWLIEIALSRRDNMSFPMLLGRTAIRSRFRVDPGRSFLAGKMQL